MSHGRFKKLGKSKRRTYGPRKLTVCGFAPWQQQLLLDLLRQGRFNDLPVSFLTATDGVKTLGEVIGLSDGAGLGQESTMRRAIIMSGLTEKELHMLMGAYRGLDLPRPLWATLTPVSEQWTVHRVLDELAAESEAFARKAGGESDLSKPS
jgi:hypothetical protein